MFTFKKRLYHLFLSLIAPTGYPPNLRVSDVTNTSAIVTWEPVEPNKRNSEISGYILQYKSTSTKVTHSKSVNSPSTVRTEIRFEEFTTKYQMVTTCISKVVIRVTLCFVFTVNLISFPLQ